MKQHKLASDAKCPGCNERVDGATAIDAKTSPKPGDLSVCFHCGCLLQFTDARGHVEHLPLSVFQALPQDLKKNMARLQSTVLRELKGGRV